MQTHDGTCKRTEPSPQSPIGKSFESCVNGLLNASQHILTPLPVRSKDRPPFKRRQSKTEQVIKKRQRTGKKTKYRQDNTDGGTEIPAQSDVFCHTNAPPICESDNLVGTQESNNAVMDNMALLLGLAHSWWSFKSVVQTTIDMKDNISYSP
ncbi:unnamed protein product [Prunus armeniaca]|uniref:Uncharacterized protein n=1 Tax=Prunus armeniaca TaxID=36596 RepID=A0A6J5VQM3_PRUAR|nr:unnamed protein product [Prunus armeniaca]CAB4320564.1 unnamed protein product [Prunus armeniaca]